MAKSAANYAAYQQSRPLQGNIGQTMQYWNEDAARRRGEDQQQEQFAWKKEQTEKLRKERENKQRREDYDKYVKPFNTSDTGSKSLNALQAEMLSSAQKQYAPLILKLEEAKRAKDNKGEIDARIKLQELGQFADRLKTVTDIYTTYRDEAKQALDNGEIYQEEFDEWDKSFQNGFQGIRGGLDENFKPVLAFVDKDGDGVNDIKDVATFDNITSLQSLPRFLKKANMETMAGGLADAYKNSIDDRTTDNGYKRVNTVKPKEEVLKNAVKNRLYDTDGGYTDLMKSLAFSKGMGYDITPEKAKTLEEELLNSTLGHYKNKYAENVTASRGGGSSSSKTEQPQNITGFNVTETDFGNYAKNVDNNTYWGVNVPSKKLSPTSKPVKLILDAPENGNNSNFMIDKYTVSKENGKDVIVASGNYVSDKGGKDIYEEGSPNNPETKQRAEIILSESEVNQLSNWLGKNPYDAAKRPESDNKESKQTKPTFPEWKKQNPKGTFAEYNAL